MKHLIMLLVVMFILKYLLKVTVCLLNAVTVMALMLLGKVTVIWISLKPVRIFINNP